MKERLRQVPGEAARQEHGLPEGVYPARWTLRSVRASFDWLRSYTLSGVWRVMQRAGCQLRSGRLRQYSPDPDYGEKVAYLEQCLRAVACAPERTVLVFIDEMGYYRWPTAARDWMGAAPEDARRTQPDGNNKPWRVIGALNAWTGQVDYLDNYIVGRQVVISMYHRLDEAYPDAERIFVAQDNWSIHKHPDVLAAVAPLERIEPLWLPTYAPWLNPIEKLWRWLRQDVLKLHRLAHDWEQLRAAVNAFLDQFAHGSTDLLHYVGLLGDGRLARARSNS